MYKHMNLRGEHWIWQRCKQMGVKRLETCVSVITLFLAKGNNRRPSYEHCEGRRQTTIQARLCLVFTNNLFINFSTSTVLIDSIVQI